MSDLDAAFTTKSAIATIPGAAVVLILLSALLRWSRLDFFPPRTCPIFYAVDHFAVDRFADDIDHHDGRAGSFGWGGSDACFGRACPDGSGDRIIHSEPGCGSRCRFVIWRSEWCPCGMDGDPAVCRHARNARCRSGAGPDRQRRAKRRRRSAEHKVHLFRYGCRCADARLFSVVRPICFFTYCSITPVLALTFQHWAVIGKR